MTARWFFDEQPRTEEDPLLPGATPAAIRDALLPEDRERFDDAYPRALASTREQLDLTELFRCLEHWRRVALLQRDPERFASIARRAAERLTGEQTPSDEPLEQTRRPPACTRRGLITYLVLEELRRVDLLDVLWLD